MNVKLYITCSTVKSQHRKMKVYHMFNCGIPTQESESISHVQLWNPNTGNPKSKEQCCYL